MKNPPNSIIKDAQPKNGKNIVIKNMQLRKCIDGSIFQEYYKWAQGDSNPRPIG